MLRCPRKRVNSTVPWQDGFEYCEGGVSCEHQRGYNKALAAQFTAMGWESQRRLLADPRLIGDSRKGLVVVEVQFGNSATLYRDYYKCQYGLANGLLSLAVLVVPVDPVAFFPTRPKSVTNMAGFNLANTRLTVLPINVPTMLVGLLPAN
jgi:hypothetical protein